MIGQGFEFAVLLSEVQNTRCMVAKFVAEWKSAEDAKAWARARQWLTGPG